MALCRSKKGSKHEISVSSPAVSYPKQVVDCSQILMTNASEFTIVRQNNMGMGMGMISSLFNNGIFNYIHGISLVGVWENREERSLEEGVFIDAAGEVVKDPANGCFIEKSVPLLCIQTPISNTQDKAGLGNWIYQGLTWQIFTEQSLQTHFQSGHSSCPITNEELPMSQRLLRVCLHSDPNGKERFSKQVVSLADYFVDPHQQNRPGFDIAKIKLTAMRDFQHAIELQKDGNFRPLKPKKT